jgi:hypothetical protein
MYQNRCQNRYDESKLSFEWSKLNRDSRAILVFWITPESLQNRLVNCMRFLELTATIITLCSTIT